MAVFSLCFQVVSLFLGISNGNSRSFHSQSHAKQCGLAVCFGNITVLYVVAHTYEAGAYLWKEVAQISLNFSIKFPSLILKALPCQSCA